ncbi:MAG TPA: hypothetical protein VF920_14860, partial [Dongiaceae bacterium]
IARLLAALSRDGVDPGYLRPFLWRRGRLASPPLFLKISTDGLVNVTLMLIWFFFFGLQRGLWLAGLLFGLAVCWELLVKLRRSGHAVLTSRSLVALVILVPLSVALVIYRPLDWPPVAEMVGGLGQMGSVLLLCLVVNLVKHWRQYRRRRLPRWADYVDAALLAEVF